MFDLCYLDRHNVNTLFLLKLNTENYFQIPRLRFMMLYVWIKRMETFIIQEVVAAFCTLIFLTKKKPIVLKMGFFKEFRKNLNDLFIFVKLSNKSEISFLYTIFLRDIFVKISKFDYIISFVKNNDKSYFLGHLQINQYNSISFMETSALYIYWKNCLLGLYVKFDAFDYTDSMLYFSLLKFWKN